MTELYLHDQKTNSIFQLIGEKENNITYSVGWALNTNSQFLQNFLKLIKIKSPICLNKIKIRLQKYEKNGFTDIELIQGNDFHIIVEAKRGWEYPTNKQITKYLKRPSFKNSQSKDKRIIIFNESTQAFTKAHFDLSTIKSVPVQIISWRQIQQIAQKSIKPGKDADNRLIKELNIYLDKMSTMQKKDSNRVFIVSLASGKPNNWKISWQDIVNKKRKYFHPVGGGIGGWPKEPPNYIAFRYNGKLQSIHHIDKYEVFIDPSSHFSEIPKEKWPSHYLYHLGPAIKPDHEVKAGKKILRNMRVWAMLDLLLTCKTIQEARDETKKRENKSS